MSQLHGLVIQHGANRYLVQQDDDGAAEPRIWACSVRGRLRRGRQESVKAAVIGDRVRFQATSDEQGVIEEVLPRRNQISRPAPSGKSRRTMEQVVMANLDTLWVIASVAQPPLNLRFIDRILAAARFQEVETSLVFNKVDLTDEPTGALRVLYEKLGYRVLQTSAESGEGVDEFREALGGTITAFVGLSGVGKSSLLARVQPGLELRVASVGEKSGHGRHTTTHSRLYPLDNGGYVADTPGMREFGLWGMFKSDLAAGFVEIDERRDECKFRDCLHGEEPQCAVRIGVEAGEIDETRYASYKALLDEVPLDQLERDGILREPRR